MPSSSLPMQNSSSTTHGRRLPTTSQSSRMRRPSLIPASRNWRTQRHSTNRAFPNMKAKKPPPTRSLPPTSGNWMLPAGSWKTQKRSTSKAMTRCKTRKRSSPTRKHARYPVAAAVRPRRHAYGSGNGTCRAGGRRRAGPPGASPFAAAGLGRQRRRKGARKPDFRI